MGWQCAAAVKWRHEAAGALRQRLCERAAGSSRQSAPMSTTNPCTPGSRRTAQRPCIEVRRSGIHGEGVFATRVLRAGQKVGEYSGRRYPPDEADDAWDSGLTYLFGLSDGSTIDGAQEGNDTRHLNHACEPNVEAVEHRRRDGTLGLSLRTLRRVSRGEELFLDYALVIAASEHPADYPCACGGVACRGTMAASSSAIP